MAEQEFDGRQAERLTAEIDALYEGFGDVESAEAAFDEAVVLVPTIGGNEIVMGLEGGVRWISAFSSLRELAAFARTAADDGEQRGYLAVRGARLREVLTNTTTESDPPFGIAIDPSGSRPWAFPPPEPQPQPPTTPPTPTAGPAPTPEPS